MVPGWTFSFPSIPVLIWCPWRPYRLLACCIRSQCGGQAVEWSTSTCTLSSILSRSWTLKIRMLIRWYQINTFITSSPFFPLFQLAFNLHFQLNVISWFCLFLEIRERNGWWLTRSINSELFKSIESNYPRRNSSTEAFTKKRSFES